MVAGESCWEVQGCILESNHELSHVFEVIDLDDETINFLVQKGVVLIKILLKMKRNTLEGFLDDGLEDIKFLMIIHFCLWYSQWHCTGKQQNIC